ncbi:DUF932 domain-containing protein [Pseudaminobacter sp. 19-2017]|uniref:DUF932 domain-containing protein n=1 Tax=Pseudaminobacter soli (ex Zhang et al. 2022) TaxID=2831468 RepID=A0A942E5G5_9HYPH|nr:DUF932 domain-containing protein [Pseudaminobacter soli]MBS3648822.1 DUF932 domain-containing protein [Pseudaminobacter soli]
MTTLINAHNNWARRAPDERFSSVADLHAAALNYKNAARQTSNLPATRLEAKATEDGAVVLNGSMTETKLTHWSFGQLAKIADAPAGYLQDLPAPLAADCLNNGLRKAGGKVNLFYKMDDPTEPAGMRTLRALTSNRYTRIWNSDITRRLGELEAEGPWQPAPAAFDGSRGLYLGDRDMFAFMVDNDRRIFETGPAGGLSRGFFVENSEVGAASFKFTSFLYEFVCGNHRVWGASEVKEVRIRHVGAADDSAFRQLEAELVAYANASAADDELKIQRMRRYTLGKDLDAVIDTVMGLRVPGLGKKMIEAGYDRAEQYIDWYGAPNTAWALAGGLTQIARDMPNANDRVALERASSKVMEMAF